MPVPLGITRVNRTNFYSDVRKSIFGGKLSQLQVDGFEIIFNEWEARFLNPYEWLAYILATTYHESGHTMQPIAEYGKGRGYKYGVPDRETGKVYYGRGFCQITWKYNYERFSRLLGVDLVNNPDLALDCKVATDILFDGMIKGLFTGKRLSDYFNAEKTDWVNARRIINGVDCAIMIAQRAKQFYHALITPNS